MRKDVDKTPCVMVLGITRYHAEFKDRALAGCGCFLREFNRKEVSA